MFPNPSSWRIVRGDKVQVMVGKDKNKQGTVLRVVRDQKFPRVFVQGVNMITRRIPKQTTMAGDVRRGFSVRMEAPIHYSNVMLVDPLTNKPVRTYFMFEDQPPYKRVRKTRGRNASNSLIPWPEAWKADLAGILKPGDKDTKMDVVAENSYGATNGMDFTLEIPSAHTQLQRVKAQRAAAAAEKAAARQQLLKQVRPLLFTAGQGSRKGSEGAAASSTRSYSSSCEAVGSSGSSSAAVCRSAAGSLLMLQRSMLCSSGRSQVLGWVGRPLHLQRLSWCGLAAAPLLL